MKTLRPDRSNPLREKLYLVLKTHLSQSTRTDTPPKMSGLREGLVLIAAAILGTVILLIVISKLHHA